MQPITVAVVEDREQYRQAIERIFAQKPDLKLVGMYTSAENLLEFVPVKLKPDIILMDIELPGITGVEAVEILQTANPEIEIIILTIYEDNENVFNALRAGALGYILKTASADEIYNAIVELKDGGSPMSDGIARKVARFFREYHLPPLKETRHSSPKEALLSPREKEVMDLLAKGYRYKEIADTLFIAQETVRKHIHNIYKKLQVSSRTEAILKLRL